MIDSLFLSLSSQLLSALLPTSLQICISISASLWSMSHRCWVTFLLRYRFSVSTAIRRSCNLFISAFNADTIEASVPETTKYAFIFLKHITTCTHIVFWELWCILGVINLYTQTQCRVGRKWFTEISSFEWPNIFDQLIIFFFFNWTAFFIFTFVFQTILVPIYYNMITRSAHKLDVSIMFFC